MPIGPSFESKVGEGLVSLTRSYTRLLSICQETRLMEEVHLQHPLPSGNRSVESAKRSTPQPDGRHDPAEDVGRNRLDCNLPIDVFGDAQERYRLG